ncbi:PREDICTED: putative F-box protein At3g44060 [Camelina sativa]|uniref:F-box protein At3g44060 n=1 Tax=Camelina sativa TaxID=90675 RepID=A0ABM0ZET7_CAMSA|nr:PREDICTED: putative F-box protein At3g44060 [Camelina sativa]
MFQEPLGMRSVSMDCVASMDCLPDDLLVQILSFLPTKQAVSTSLLSKRWRTLFAFSPNLDFDNPILKHSEDIRKSFNDFVDSSLVFQGDNHIKKFSLKNTGSWYMEHDVKRWIRSALEHGVSELHLQIEGSHLQIGYIRKWQYFPFEVFTSTTLVDLSLGIKQDIQKFSPHAYLPALKVLVLDSIWFHDGQLFNEFLAACPALEDLTIRYKEFQGHSYIISSKSIKKLSVTINCSYYADLSSTIILDTPNVFDLYYYGFPRCKAPHCNLNSLAKATLDLHFLKDHSQHRQMQNEADVKDLISEIRNVKTLHLNSSAVEVILVCCKGGLPVFKNLVKLVLSSKKKGWRMFLPLLLERSPKLKTLVLSDLHRYTFRRTKLCVGVQIPSNNKIKMLSVLQYQGSANELKHINHFLLKMECLEMVKVYVAAEMDDLKKMQLTDDLFIESNTRITNNSRLLL